MTDEQASKRELLKKAAYIAPTILTLKIAPAFAQSGSGQQGQQGANGNNGVRNGGSNGNNGVGNGVDPQPPGNPRPNDGPGTGPGNPGSRP